MNLKLNFLVTLTVTFVIQYYVTVVTWYIHIFQFEYLDECLLGIIPNDVGNRNCFMVCTNTHSVSRHGFDIAIYRLCKLS